MARSPVTRARLLAAVALSAIAALSLPVTALAHAELQVATPKDGATVAGSPPEISGTYSQAMKTNGSSLTLVGADGSTIAKGGVDPANDLRMAIDPVPTLAPGTYTVKSTTISAQDGDVDRKQWSFTVVPAPTSTPTLAPSASAAPSASSAPTVAPSPSTSIAPTPSAGTNGSGSGGDVLLPILAALAIVAVGGALLLGRRGRTGPPA